MTLLACGLLLLPIAASRADAGTPFQVRGAGAVFDTALPPSSVATYLWAPDHGVVHEWLTTAVGSVLEKRLERQPDLPTTTPGGVGRVVGVDAGATYQHMAGFGGAMTDSAAALIAASPYRDAIMNALFGSSGARLRFVRVPMGASDLATEDYDYDTLLPGIADPSLSAFSVAHDTVSIVPLLQEAHRLRPDLTLLGTPWSAPAWMKTGRSFHGTCGSNTLDPSLYGVYAQYITKFVTAYRSGYGLPVRMVSLQNEPHNCNASYATMNLEPDQEARLSRDLRTALDAAGLGSVRILGWDHNWYDGGRAASYPDTLLADGGRVDAIGYHCYDGTGPHQSGPAVQSQFHRDHPRTAIYMTECSGFTAAPNASENLVWEVRNALIGPIVNWARTSLYWSLALGSDGGPHVGGCGDCRGMIAIDRATGAYQPSEDYYYWAHFSKFVAPGAVRIGSSDPGDGSIETVAFRNPDGTIVVVAVNTAVRHVDRRGHIVQWAGDRKRQRTAWLVGPDGRRRWISDIATYNCLKRYGAPGPDVLSAGELDALPDLNGVWAVCGADRIGVDSILQTGFYAQSHNGRYRLSLSGSDLALTDAGGHVVWSTGRGGDELVLQRDGNLVEYAGGRPVWASGTVGSGSAWLVVRDDGKLALYNGAGQLAWTSEAPPSSYVGHIVQWDSDPNAQRTAWLVGPDGHRRWISDIATYNCLKSRGAPGPDVLTSWELDRMPDLNGVWAVCGVDRIGVNSMLQTGLYAQSGGGRYRLTLSGSDLMLTDTSGRVVWSTGRGGDELVLQGDGNLVEYASGTAVWASGTVGSGAAWLVVRDDGKLALYNAAGGYVWTSEGPPSRYVGHIVQWDNDPNTQKTAWLVGSDGHRRWIADAATYNCLKSHGMPGPDVLTSWELNQLPDLNGIWATCH
ncbi:MAG: hypothetical protein JSS99_00120 [Actinobacteria bacterium]|nr:hypothetical protein [Actinomycetota bacterium]